MKWTILIGLWSFLAVAQRPMVFMREEAAEKQIILRQGESESPLTTGKDWHLYPDISADGQWVVWVEGPDDKDLSIVLYNTVTQTRERWETALKGMTLHPRFSKNAELIFFSAPTNSGNKIVFFSPAKSRTRLSRRESNGTNVYHLTPEEIPHVGQGFFPRPSSDGNFIVFQQNGPAGKEIVEYQRLTKQFRVLAQGMSPALSPDDTWLVYTSKIQGSWDIWIMNRQSGDRYPLTQETSDEMAPTFAANQRVVFATNRDDDRYQLFEIIKGEWQQIVKSSADDYAPMFGGEGQWRQSLQPPFLGPLRSSFGAIAHQGKIYLCGGHAGAEHTYPPESFTDNLQVFDPARGLWQELAPRPHKAHGFQLSAYGNYLYAFGGFAYNEETRPRWKSLDVIDRYDITTNRWETIGKMPRPRSSNAAVTIAGKVYLIGGWDATPQADNDAEGRFHRAVDIFDLTTEQIQVARWEIPLPLRRAFSAVEYLGNIVLIGGLGVGSTHFELLNQVTMIEPETGLAQELSPLPFPTFAPAAGVINNELLVFGGMYKTGEYSYDYVSHIYALNFTQDSWRHTGRYLTETKGFSQVTPFQTGLAVLGGHRYFDDLDQPVATFELFSKSSK